MWDKIYAVCHKETGSIIETAFTYEEAEEILEEFEEGDVEKGIYKEDFYEIAVFERKYE